jgi:CheY-like chemotaxis protein
LPSKLLIDSERLLQVMVNLISNAIKSTPNDGQIYIEASWYGGGGQNDTETFLKLIKPKDFRGLRSPLSSDTRETEEEEERGRPLEVIRRASTSNILEFSFEEESRHQKNLIALGRNSSQKLSVFGGSEHWVIKRQKLSGRKGSLMDPSRARLGGGGGQREQFGYLKVQVSDTGSGMNEESISTIFDVKNLEIGENDLSLWICKQICNKMNGEIICASTVNYGTDYVFYIPVNNAGEENQRCQKDKVRALVVDDYDFNRNLHKLLLEREGVHVTLACDGKEALERYKERGNDYYDVIMMDINMPVMNGITAAKKIREWEMLNGYKEADIVFISGDYFNEDEILENWPRKEGVEIVENIGFMKKPIEIKRIVKIVDKYKNRLHKPRTLQNI